MRKLFFAIVFMVLLVVMLFNGISVKAGGWDGTIKIGALGRMQSIQGWGIEEGCHLAAEQINLGPNGVDDGGDGDDGIVIGGLNYKVKIVRGDTSPIIDPHVPPYPGWWLAVSGLVDAGCDFVVGSDSQENNTFRVREVLMDYNKMFFITGDFTNELIDCGTGTCGKCVRCDYDRYKYMFRVSPVNATTILNTLVAFLKDHVLPQELAPIYGSPVKTYIVAENLVWCDGMVASLQAGALGTQAEIVGVARPSATESNFAPIIAAVPADVHLVIHIFSAVAGKNYIATYGTMQPNFTTVGINMESQRQEFYNEIGGLCEYESFLAPLGTRTPIIAGVTDKFWDDYVARYGHAPIRTAWGAYDAIVALAETLGNPALVQAWPMTCDQLISIIEQTNRTGTLGKFKYTQHHDVFCNEIDSTWTQGYVRPLVVQWQADKMEVVWPQDQPYSRNYKIPPWMYIFKYKFDVVLDDIHYPVSILSNSTVSNFNFNQTKMQISFNVTGESGATGYCNVTIPKNLLTGSTWTIKIDNTTITDFDEKTNNTHTFLYFTYTHESPLQVTIKGTWVVPEFPSALILPLFMILSLTTVVFVKLKKKKQ